MRPVLTLLAALGVVACTPQATPTQPTVELGVFYGGQIQRRQRIALQFDRSQQLQGFRVSFPQPTQVEQRLSWEVDKPIRTGRSAKPERVVELGEAQLRAGTRRVDQPLFFGATDALGSWTVRVQLDDRQIFEQRIEIVGLDAPLEAPTQDAAGAGP